MEALNAGHTGLAEAIGRLCIGEETLREPHFLQPPGHWAGHVPFAFWIVSVLQPRTLVEIGTGSGNSYLAFCQAIEAERNGARAYAINTCEGDARSAHENQLFESLSAYHDPRYGHFSSLICAPFDEARNRFNDGSIDLLHIDAVRTYESAASIFAAWKSALSDRAVILFHDTNGRRPTDGVWRLWEELARAHPHFAFFHSCGLGVLGMGVALPEPLQALFRASADAAESALIRAYFAARGAVGINRLAQQIERERNSEAARRHEAQLGEAMETAIRVKADNKQVVRRLAAIEINNAEIKARLQAANVLRKGPNSLAAAADAAIEALAAARALSLKHAEELQALRASTSWRVTAPLRWVVELARVGRRARREATAATLLLPDTRPELQSVAEKTASLDAVEETQNDAPPTGSRSAPPPEVSLEPLKMPDLFALRGFRARARIAVVAHVWYPDSYQEILDAIENLSEDFDLFVTLVQAHSDHLQDAIKARFPDAHIWCFPNRGRDIMPFMSIAATGALAGYELICKLHTAGSPHHPEGGAQSRQRAAGILPDRNCVAKLIAAFDADPDLGIVAADGEVFEGEAFCGGDTGHFENLLSLLGWSLKQMTRLRFAGGSTYWLRPLLLRDLVGLALSPEAYEPEPVSADGALAPAMERLFSIACHSAGLRIELVSQVATTADEKQSTRAPAPRVVAFYLPQFHPIAENDQWWGRGFTEWTNVTKARPLFPGHRQPRLPGELGFTDLRLPETRAAQAALASTYGVSAFCYYYYWFGEGRRLLNRPLDEVLASGEPDFPFMICWANEPWSRNWDGENKEVLMAQDYPDGWIEAFARDLAPILRDPRYVRLDGPDHLPVLLIYRTLLVPEPAASMAALRTALRKLGAGEIHISAGWFSLRGDGALPEDPADLGCDSFFEFPPHNLPAVPATSTIMVPGMSGQIFDYVPTVDAALARLTTAPVAHGRHPGVMLGWDNTARRAAAAHVFRGATPCHFRRWLRGVVRQQQATAGSEERLIFVNAWNEWAEGTCLEPDQDFGRGWLEAVQSALGYRKRFFSEEKNQKTFVSPPLP